MEPPTNREVIKKLEKEGYEKVAQVGSHRKYSNGKRTVTVAGKPSEHQKRGTWKRTKEQAGW